MTHSFKNPLLVALLVLILVISSYFMWKYLNIKNQELQIKLNQEKVESDKIKINEELTEVRVHRDSIVRFNDTNLEISTKWRDGKMDYKISLPVSEKFYNAITNPDNWNARLTIELVDKDGFKIDEIYLYIRDATTIIDKSDKMIEKSESGSKEISKESYMMIHGINILSTIN